MPVAVEPVRSIWSTPGWTVSAAPVSRRPVTICSTPSGRPASRVSAANSMTESGASSLGLTISVLPQASAGAIFLVAISSGWFQGVSAAHTPTGTRSV